MPAVVIADTSCLIYLTALVQLELLPQLYSAVWITPTVAAEYGLPLPPWMQVQAPREEIRTIIFGASIDIGEASAIALALETPDCVLVLDDRRGRKAANRLHLLTTGTLGLLVAAKQRGLLPAVRPLVAQLLAGGMHLAPEVEANIYAQAGE